jgi:FtsH-binding integral membrane protein
MVGFFSSKTKVFIIFGLFAFVTLSVFGLSHTAWMPKNDNGDMTGCIFTGQVMLCKMSIIEHISLWQSMFTALPQKSLALTALVVLLLTAIFVTKNILDPPSLSNNKASAQKLYLAQHPDIPLFDPLKEAFSRGILNPKIYELATL